MYRIALLLLILATLVGCSGGTKSAPNPEPGPVVPTPSTEIPDRYPHRIDGQGAGPSASANEPSNGEPLGDPVDWIELRTAPFQHGETERLILHLASPADELSWYTHSVDRVDDVRSDQGETHYFIEGWAEGYRTYINGAGLKLECVPSGYREIDFECWISRGDTVTRLKVSYFPHYVPPRPEGMRQWGLVGASGEEHSWGTGLGEHVDDIQWDFGGGAAPNTGQGLELVHNVLGAPGRYTASYTLRNEWGFSGPHKIGYWVQPFYSTHSLGGLKQQGTPSLVVVDDRIRMLLPTEEGYRYVEALTATPESVSDWRFTELPLPATHLPDMQLGMHAGNLLIIGGRGSSGSSDVILYYRAAVASPREASDWDVGGIPDSDGLIVLDQEINPDRVGLLVRKSTDVGVLWDATSTLSGWHYSEMAHGASLSQIYSNRLLLPETGPAVIGWSLLPEEPAGLTYRSATYDKPNVWSAHRILDVPPDNFPSSQFACIFQGRPLVLARVDQFTSALLRSCAAQPTSVGDWEQLETTDEVVVPGMTKTFIQVSGDRIVMSPLKIRAVQPWGGDSGGWGGLLLEDNVADLAEWTPFLAPLWFENELIVATVLTDEGVGVLSRDIDVLSFGMLKP